MSIFVSCYITVRALRSGRSTCIIFLF